MYHIKNILQENFSQNTKKSEKTSIPASEKKEKKYTVEKKQEPTIAQIKACLDTMPPFHLAVANIVFNFLRKCKTCTLSQKTLAKKVGCSERTAFAAIKTLKREGVIKCTHRFKDSNVYTKTDTLKDKTILQKLASYVPGLRSTLCLTMLLSGIGLQKATKAQEFKLPSEKKAEKECVMKDTNGIFWPQKDCSVESCGQLLYKEDILKSSNVCMSHWCQRRDAQPWYQQEQERILFGPRTQKRLESKKDYAFLSDYGRYLAHQMGLSPRQSLFLAFYPDNALKTCLRMYAYACLKSSGNPIRNRTKYIQSLLTMIKQDFNVHVDPTIFNCMATEFGISALPINLTPQQKIALLQETAYIGREVEETLKREYEQTRERAKEQIRKKEKEKAASVVQQQRTNPYSVYYTGPHSDKKEKKEAKQPSHSWSLEDFETFCTTNLEKIKSFLQGCGESQEDIEENLRKQKLLKSKNLSEEDKERARQKGLI